MILNRLIFLAIRFLDWEYRAALTVNLYNTRLRERLDILLLDRTASQRKLKF
jgi:hypothetical protein